MDIATLAGLGLGIGMILYSVIDTGVPLSKYVSIGSVAMVLGGSLASIIISNPLQRVMKIGSLIRKIFTVNNFDIEGIIATLVKFSEKARREGLLALEDDLEEIDDEFMKKGIQLVVDGTDPEIISAMLYGDLNQQQERHADGIKLFENWGLLSPAFGMIGTLVGLIAMLSNLDDPDSIGSGMALALITTLYGSVFANLLFIPFGNKLKDRDREETLVKEVQIEGILSIQSGDNPRILETKLASFLAPAKREVVREEIGGD